MRISKLQMSSSSGGVNVSLTHTLLHERCFGMAPAGPRPVSDHTLRFKYVYMCVCVQSGKVRIKKSGTAKRGRGGTFRARKPTAAVKAERDASVVSSIKKQKLC